MPSGVRRIALLHISSKYLLILMVWSSLAPKWPIPVPFYGMFYQKSNILLKNWYTLCWTLLRPADVNFLKTGQWKTKPLGTLIQKNYWTFYPSEPFRILRFNMRHPVEYSWMSLSGDSPSLPSLALQCSISIEFSLN